MLHISILLICGVIVAAGIICTLVNYLKLYNLSENNIVRRYIAALNMSNQSDSINKALKAIKDYNMVFVSAQPDTPYFHWQIEIYLYQFAKWGIIDRCYAIVGYTGSGPSSYMKNLAKKYPGIKFYPDERKDKKYIPTIRPHILKQFFRDFPELGKNCFYHDSDIFLTGMPRFDQMLGDNIAYLSDTRSYIGYQYISNCANRYKTKHSHLPHDDIFYQMCKMVGINPQLVKDNQDNSGGAQYLLKGIDSLFWEECESMCKNMYDFLCSYEKKHPITHHIQKWTTDMWVVLWNYWKRGGITKLHNDLAFSWGTSNMADYKSKKIFHLAGITSANNKDKFHKSKYTRQTVFDAYLKNPKIFDHVDPGNATYAYCEILKEYYNNVYLPERGLVGKSTDTKINNVVFDKSDGVKRFKIISSNSWGTVYCEDKSKLCCDKSIWRSIDKRYLIFHTGRSWVITYAKYENQIGPRCGGLVSNDSEFPYENGWNIRCAVELLF